jgi:hypothetical protein
VAQQRLRKHAILTTPTTIDQGEMILHT